MLNSAWPSLYWQQYDWYGAPTAGYYGTKKACEPRQLLFDYATRKVYAVNESADAEPRTMQAVLRVFDAGSKLIGTETKPVTVGYREVVPVFDLRRFDGRPHFVALTAEVEMTVDGNQVTLENKSGVIAYMNILKAKDAAGNLVVPAYWSDNFFPLLPGEKKTVTCRTDAKDIHFELDK